MSLNVMVNGMPGNMAKEVAAAVLRRGWTLVPYSLTAPETSGSLDFHGIPIRMLAPGERVDFVAEIKSKWPNLIVVDYTHPSAVNDNASFYTQHGFHFVMGTTGGDRQRLHGEVLASDISAVIAPNMAKPIVALQSMMQQMAERYPDVFSGSKLRVVESHQSTKADTSGTAKAIVASFNRMGIPFEEEQIEMLRLETDQLAFGVPDNYLDGHAFHTYTVTSPDGTCELAFQHNVCGRRIYAEGTCDAVAFLARQLADHSEKRLFNMIDVLESGALN